MRHIPLADRPRERLASVGPTALGTRELLAVLVGSGGPGGSALEVADLLLEASEGSLRRMGSSPPGALRRLPGVGEATATRILAALELGRRAAEEVLSAPERIRGPEDVHALLGPLLRDLPQEEFHALLLNAQHRVMRRVLVTRGILDASLIHAREVFRPAILESAAAVVLVHNHPSGDPTPSAEDRAVTQHLSGAGRSLGIRVLDHVIVGREGFVSLAREGLVS